MNWSNKRASRSNELRVGKNSSGDFPVIPLPILSVFSVYSVVI